MNDAFQCCTVVIRQAGIVELQHIARHKLGKLSLQGFAGRPIVSRLLDEVSASRMGSWPPLPADPSWSTTKATNPISQHSPDCTRSHKKLPSGIWTRVAA